MTKYSNVMKKLKIFIENKKLYENTIYCIKSSKDKDCILYKIGKNPYNELLACLYDYFYNLIYDKVIFRKDKIIIHNKNEKYYLYIYAI